MSSAGGSKKRAATAPAQRSTREWLGSSGPIRGRLIREGWLETPAGRIHIDDVSETRPGQRFAFLMDTALCDVAVELAEGADLVVCESTYLDDEADLADRNRHLTTPQAGWIAAEAGVRQLVLTHFSQRHGDERVYAREASDVLPAVVAARDLTIVAVPPCDMGEPCSCRSHVGSTAVPMTWAADDRASD